MEVWSHGSDVTTIYPIGGREVGWEQVAAICSGCQVTRRDPLIRIVGDLAYQGGIESGEGTLAAQHVSFEHRVTNVYHREAGGWKVVYHHPALSPAMLDVREPLQPPPG